MGALDGIRVVEAGLLVQGPQAAALLGDLGAEVVKVELPGFGDASRWLPVGPDQPISAYFVACNRGKRSVTADLRTEGGRRVFRRLAARADVVITNYKPGTMDDWGLGYEVLAELNPGLVWAAGSTFGPLGADAGREGADLSGQAAGGLISTIGIDGGDPSPVGATIADHMAAQNLVAGILAALVARGRTGRGQRVEVSLLGSQIWAQASEYTFYLLTGRPAGRANRANPMIAGLYGIFPTADGWLAVVGVPGPNRDAFFHEVGLPELLDDPRFARPLLTPEHKAALFEALTPVFRQRTTQEWCRRLVASGQRVAPVRDHAEVIADAQAWDNGYLVVCDDGVGGTSRVVGSPIRFSDTPSQVDPAVPELGQHTEEVLLELGFGWDEIGALRDTGAI